MKKCFALNVVITVSSLKAVVVVISVRVEVAVIVDGTKNLG